jgi:short-subunit dehydrogenase
MTRTQEAEQHGGAPGGRPLAVVTGATAGIGHELARVFAQEGFDVVAAAEDGRVDGVVAELRGEGAEAHGVRVDLATAAGCEELVRVVEALGRPVDALALNAGVGVAGAFVETGTLEDQMRVIDLDVTAVVRLTHRLAPAMVARGEGRILVTSSIVAPVAAPYQATYSASKGFVQSFAHALREELRASGVTVTALRPGGTAPEHGERSGAVQEETTVAEVRMDDPGQVARQGYEALVRGDDHVVAGRRTNAVLATAGELLPDAVGSRLSRRLTTPGSGSEG